MGKVALIDSDILCYRIGFACDNESAGTAIKTMDKFVTDLVSNRKFSSWELHLTGKGNFRDEYAVTVPYKGNRTNKPKPVHIKTLRQFLIEKWDALVAEGQEADDAIAIRATELGDESIIVSLDKDFDQVQGWHYNFVKNDLYYVTAEEGLLNFYCQFLTGDRIDNIIGVKGIGPVKAHKLLSTKVTEEDMFAVCVEHLGYDRAVENGRLLYLRRKENELWMPPTTEAPTPTPSSLNMTMEQTPPSTEQEA
jgi:hypothetical protein